MPFQALSKMILRPRWSPKKSQDRAQEPFKTLLERGCRPKPFSEAFLNVFGGSRNPKNHAPATVRAQFSLKSQFAAGGPKSSPKASQNGAQKPPWRPKTAPKGAKSRPRRSKSGPTDAKTAPKGRCLLFGLAPAPPGKRGIPR